MKNKKIVKFGGDFGFIKPWSAVRDSKTKSNFYLTPSILMGIERKLFPELLLVENGELNFISRYRLSFQDVVFQQESTSSILPSSKVSKLDGTKYNSKNLFITERGILIKPILYLMFNPNTNIDDVLGQHICLCRNEDLMFPLELIENIEEDIFDTDDKYSGYESFGCLESDGNSIFCGLNKYTKEKQFIKFKIFGTPNNLK